MDEHNTRKEILELLKEYCQYLESSGADVSEVFEIMGDISKFTDVVSDNEYINISMMLEKYNEVIETLVVLSAVPDIFDDTPFYKTLRIISSITTFAIGYKMALDIERKRLIDDLIRPN